MIIVAVIMLVCIGIKLWGMRQEHKRLHWREYREITGYDWWKVRRK